MLPLPVVRPIPAALPVWAVVYLIGYGGVVLVGACLILHRRDFN